LERSHPVPISTKRRIGELPLFPSGYDWKEQTRVRKAVGKVSLEKTPEMWEELLRNLGDRRYCLTIKDKNRTHPLGNFSVSFFCATWAGDWLVGVCHRHLPRDRKGYPIALDVPHGGLKKWRKERAHKKLYELQIEVCQETIKQLAMVKSPWVTQGKKDGAREEIEEEIANLRKRKRPVFTNYSLQPIVCYSSKEAKEIRRLLRGKK
jgi:hypothetical protein